MSLPGGYTFTYTIKTSTPAGYNSIATRATTVPTYGGAYMGNVAYVGTPGSPALGYAIGTNVAATFQLSNLTVKDSSGAVVHGWGIVAADAEATGINSSGRESMIYNSDVTLSRIDVPSASWPACTGGLTGVGTANVTCTGGLAGTGGNGALALQADQPSQIAVTVADPGSGAEDAAFAFVTSKLTLNKTVNGRVNASDSFDTSITSPEGTTLATASTGTSNSSTTGSTTVLPSTSGPFVLGEQSTTGTSTVLSNYTQTWACTNATTASTTVLPSGGGTSVALTPAPGDDVTCTVTNTAKTTALSVVKHAGTPDDVNGDGLVDAGDTIQYTFTVTNNGQLTMSNVGVVDPKAGKVSCPSLTLAPGASEECSADKVYTITDLDVTGGAVDNSATANGTPPGSTVPVTSLASATHTPTTAPAPGLSVVKSADPSDAAAYNPGQVITYHFAVTNTGNVTMNNITIPEDTFTGTGGAPSVSCPSTTLDPGAQVVCTATYTLTSEDVNAGSVTNTATVHGTPQGSSTDGAFGSSTVTIPEIPAPALTVVKSASPDTVTAAGEVVTYSFVVTNTGNVTITNPKVHDTGFTGTGGLSDADIECPETSLVAGQVETCTVPYTVTQADVDAGTITNSANVTGTTPDGGGYLSPPSPTATVTIDQIPALSIVKTANVQAAEVGQQLTYTFTVTNTGNVTVTDPQVADTGFTGHGTTLSALDCPVDVVLPPGQVETCTATYTVVQADVDAGSISNAATVSGTTVGGDSVPQVTSDPVVVSTSPHPALSLVKSASAQRVTTVGQVVTYTFAVTNTGNVDISDPKVNEGTFTGHGTLSAVTCPGDSVLPPGQMISCTATYTVVAADLADGGNLSNTATVTGTLPGGDLLTSDPSTAMVKEVAPATPAAALASTGSDLWAAGLVGLGLLVLGLLAAAAAWMQRRRTT
ncbi:DUF7507 domain-containing protein [Rathayibacter sp. KR2-224]|uniref:DUF7507 domain-containing protein n=1 Tax=Rathayibacter sp. KR2-224 TaxID=3400913 RepID=UPI003C089CFD